MLVIVDVFNTLLDSGYNLSDFESFLMLLSTYQVTATARLGIDSEVQMKMKWWCWFPKQEKKKTDPSKRYKMSKCIFGDASLDDILFNVNTMGSSLHIPDDANEL